MTEKTPLGMLPRFQVALELALSDGIPRGLNRYYKHRDEPRPHDEVQLQEMLIESIRAALHEYFIFPEEPLP